MRKLRFKKSLDILLYALSFWLVVGLVYAGVSDMDGIRLKATGDETYQVEVQNSSATRKFSVDSSGNVYVAGTLTATGAALTTPTLSGPILTISATHVFTTLADWTLSASEMLKTLLVASSGSGGANIVVSGGTTGDVKIVRNAGNGTFTIKESGQTGIAVASGKTAIVMHNGTDYIRITADATH